MNTIAINSKTYEGAEMYAKLHNISVSDAVEKAVLLLIEKVQAKKKFTDTAEFKEALAYVKSKAAKGSIPVPPDENGLDALIEAKYKL